MEKEPDVCSDGGNGQSNGEGESGKSRGDDSGKPKEDGEGNGDKNPSEPFIGMEFGSLDDARDFYNEYAKYHGFSIRSNTTKYDYLDGKLILKDFVCSKEGFRSSKNVKMAHQIRDSRTGCRAMLRIKRGRDHIEKWFIAKFSNDHNHELASPSMSIYLRSHRRLGNCQKNMHNALIVGAPGLSQTMNVTESQTGGTSEHIRSNLNKGDAQTMLNHFQDILRHDPMFYYLFSLDDDDHMHSVFWADGMSVSSYDSFGDVVKFDTTYLIDKYRLPLASFVGLNHHRQPVLFGCGLIGDERKETFVWLFKTFLVAMGGKHPRSIFSDLDEAITTAVTEVFPNSCHRFCLWHIYKKFNVKLGFICNERRNFFWKFKYCVEQVKTIEEFEVSWGLFLDEFDLRDNTWLQELYELRKHWVPIYFNDAFFAGMNATQCNESMDSFFDPYMQSQTTLQEFVQNYYKALNRRYHDELLEDAKTVEQIPRLVTESPLEKQASHLYTSVLLKDFRDEIFGTLGHFASKVEENNGVSEYRVVLAANDNGSVAHTVTFSACDTKAKCSCKMFEVQGILCRHILLIYQHEGVSSIPSCYILDRWTRKARTKFAHEKNKAIGGSKSLGDQMLRYNDLCRLCAKVAEIGSRSIRSYNTMLHFIEEALVKLDICDDELVKLDIISTERNHVEDTIEASECAEMNQPSACDIRTTILEGFYPRSRVAPSFETNSRKNKKSKPSEKGEVFEKERARTRTCSNCQQKGHDMRTCKFVRPDNQIVALNVILPGQSSTTENPTAV